MPASPRSEFFHWLKIAVLPIAIDPFDYQLLGFLVVLRMHSDAIRASGRAFEERDRGENAICVLLSSMNGKGPIAGSNALLGASFSVLMAGMATGSDGPGDSLKAAGLVYPSRNGGLPRGETEAETRHEHEGRIIE
ncbi:MAG: hypothetical protein WAZ34_14345 [Rhodocyclaceae bacterium]